jgi:hypothetical protein
MKYLLRDKRTKRIVSYSEEHPGNGNFDDTRFDVVELSDADVAGKMDKGQPIYCENAHIRLAETPETIKVKSRAEIIKLIEQAKVAKNDKDAIDILLKIIERNMVS